MVAEDASCILRKSRDASQPVILSSVSLRWYAEWFLTVVFFWQDRRKGYATRVDILPMGLLRAQGGRRSKDFRILQQLSNKQNQGLLQGCGSIQPGASRIKFPVTAHHL